MAARNLGNRHIGIKRFRDDLLLQRVRPVPAPISAAQNLHPMNGHVAILAACIVATQSTTTTARHLTPNKAAFLGCVQTIERTLTFFRLPRQHHKQLKSTNMLERLNEEIRRRTYVVRIFPNSQSCLRLVRALCVETNENWMEANRYLNMEDLREHKKLELRKAA